jgi:predicted RecB family nuclease
MIRGNGYVDLSPILIQKMGGKSRTQGRYNASELYFLNNGSTKPEDWLNPPSRAFVELMRMWKGIAAHEMVQGLLHSEWCEIKQTHTSGPITLVGKSDYLPPEFPGEVWEFKSSDNLMKDAKPWHLHQARLYATMFNKDRGVVMQPVHNDDGIFLKEIGVVERDDVWFNKEIEKLMDFHEKVEDLRNKK